VLEAEDITQRLLDNSVIDRLLKANELKPAWAVDMDGNVVECNLSARTALNESEDAILGHAMRGFVETESQADLKHGLLAAKLGKVYSAKMSLKRADQSGGYTGLEMMLDMAPRWDSRGHMCGAVVTAELPAALRVDKDLTVLEANDAACSLLGVYREDILGYDLRPYIESTKREEVQEGLSEVFVGNKCVTQHTSFMKQNEDNAEAQWEPFAVELDASPYTIPQEAGGGTGALILLQEHVRKLLKQFDSLPRKRHTGPKEGKKEDASLANMDGWAGHQWGHAEIAGKDILKKVKRDKNHTNAITLVTLVDDDGSLKHAGAASKSPEDLLWESMSGGEDEMITFETFRKYLYNTNPEDRLPVLKSVNAMFEKKVRARFNDLTGDESGATKKVGRPVFDKWLVRARKAL